MYLLLGFCGQARAFQVLGILRNILLYSLT